MRKLWNLQFFAEGGAAAGAAPAGTGTGTGATSQAAAANQASNQVDAGTGTVQEDTSAPKKASWDELTKGEYREEYQKAVSKAVKERVKAEKARQQQLAEQLTSANGIVEMLAAKYGIDATDTKGIMAAIDSDNAYYEEEANKRGMSVEQLKTMRKMEQENNLLKRQMQEHMREEQIAKNMMEWQQQSDKVKEIYPNFDFATEQKNKQFRDLITRGIPVQTAYEVIHKDEIMGGAMQYTAQQVAQQVTANIQARNSRPAENGVSSNSGIVTKTDVKSLTKAERQELARRARNGERITFGK